MSLQGWGEGGSFSYVFCFILCCLVSVNLNWIFWIYSTWFRESIWTAQLSLFVLGWRLPSSASLAPKQPCSTRSSSSWKANGINRRSDARGKWQNVSPRFTEKDKRTADTGRLYRGTLNTGLLDPSLVPLYLNRCISLPLLYRWHFWTVALCCRFRKQYHVALLPSADREVRISSAWWLLSFWLIWH